MPVPPRPLPGPTPDGGLFVATVLPSEQQSVDFSVPQADSMGMDYQELMARREQLRKQEEEQFANAQKLFYAKKLALESSAGTPTYIARGNTVTKNGQDFKQSEGNYSKVKSIQPQEGKSVIADVLGGDELAKKVMGVLNNSSASQLDKMTAQEVLKQRIAAVSKQKSEKQKVGDYVQNLLTSLSRSDNPGQTLARVLPYLRQNLSEDAIKEIFGLDYGNAIKARGDAYKRNNGIE